MQPVHRKKGAYAELGFTDQGRCVSAVRQAQRDERKAAKIERRAEVKAMKKGKTKS